MGIFNLNGRKGRRKNQKSHRTAFTSVLSPNAPFSFIEAYKTLRTNLDFIATTSQAKCILITSALPEELKSTVSINLALTLADNGKSVIVVECDLRKPSLRRYLRADRGVSGMSAVLSGTAPLDECIQKVEDKEIDLLFAGAIPPNPSELLNQPRMQELIDELKRRYDYVILDAPPVTLVTDAAVVGRMADGALLVVRSKYASTKTVRLAVQRLKAVDVRIFGAVVTRFSPKMSGWRSGYDYEYYEYGYRQAENSV